MGGCIQDFEISRILTDSRTASFSVKRRFFLFVDLKSRLYPKLIQFFFYVFLSFDSRDNLPCPDSLPMRSGLRRIAYCRNR